MPRILSARVIFYLGFLWIADLSLSPALKVFGCRPVLLYLMTPYAAFEWGWERTLSMAFIVGLLCDLVSSGVFGLQIISMVTAASILDALVQKVDRQSLLSRFFFSFFFVLTVFFCQEVFSGIFGIAGFQGWHAVGIASGVALYTGLLMPPFFWVTARWFRDRSAVRQYELFR